MSTFSGQDHTVQLFGWEREGGFESILNNIEQTFGGHPLYGTVEEKAAHLLYFIIKDHPFTDGNKVFFQTTSHSTFALVFQ